VPKCLDTSAQKNWRRSVFVPKCTSAEMSVKHYVQVRFKAIDSGVSRRIRIMPVYRLGSGRGSLYATAKGACSDISILPQRVRGQEFRFFQLEVSDFYFGASAEVCTLMSALNVYLWSLVYTVTINACTVVVINYSLVI